MIEVIEQPPTSPDLDLTENLGKNSKGKIRPYPRLITNEKDMIERMREFVGEKETCTMDLYYEGQI